MDEETRTITENLKGFTMQGMARELSLFEKALLDFEAQDPNVEGYTKTATPVLLCQYYEKIRATTQTSLDHFFKGG